MVEYATEIRVAIESFLTIVSLWWTIHTLVSMSSIKDRLLREERGMEDQLAVLHMSIIKIRDSSRKVRDKIIPGQVHIISQLRNQMEHMAKQIEASGLPARVKLYNEVKKFYTEQPDSKYFRSTDYKPGD